jgi:hypothetical protein
MAIVKSDIVGRIQSLGTNSPPAPEIEVSHGAGLGQPRSDEGIGNFTTRCVGSVVGEEGSSMIAHGGGAQEEGATELK